MYYVYVFYVIWVCISYIPRSISYLLGAYGGGLSWEVILILGISNVFADAIAMGAGEYLSSKVHYFELD